MHRAMLLDGGRFESLQRDCLPRQIWFSMRVPGRSLRL
jgi:hypothetical protein